MGTTVSIELGDEEQWEKTIVGVVEDVPLRGLDQAHPPALYTPLAQTPWNTQEIVVRTTVPGETMLPAIRGALGELDPDLPAYDVTTLPDLLAATTARPRVQMQLISAFAVLAVLLAVVGAYGVLSFVVAARRREIGVRMAVGATRGDVRGLILREGLSGVGVGTVLGLTIALAGTRLLGGVIFGVRPHDPVVLGAAAGVILLAGLAASVAPSWRAARVEPRTALAAGE